VNTKFLDKVVDQILSETKICSETKIVTTPFLTTSISFSRTPIHVNGLMGYDVTGATTIISFHSFHFDKLPSEYDYMSGVSIGMKVHLREIYGIKDGCQLPVSSNPCIEIPLESNYDTELGYILNKYRDTIASKIFNTPIDKLEIIA
tara:strand:- start:4172 stop:4612 length:441 start_codon:yes stop_codon:yes gene_type:complete